VRACVTWALNIHSDVPITCIWVLFWNMTKFIYCFSTLQYEMTEDHVFSFRHLCLLYIGGNSVEVKSEADHIDVCSRDDHPTIGVLFSLYAAGRYMHCFYERKLCDLCQTITLPMTLSDEMAQLPWTLRLE